MTDMMGTTKYPTRGASDSYCEAVTPVAPAIFNEVAKNI